MSSSDAQVPSHFPLSTYPTVLLETKLPYIIQIIKLRTKDSSVLVNAKLSLQSVVCHKERCVDPSYCVSLVRSPNPNQHVDDRWLQFDSLAHERVADKDIEHYIRRECTLLLGLTQRGRYYC